jgi:hypothetical protein
VVLGLVTPLHTVKCPGAECSVAALANRSALLGRGKGRWPCARVLAVDWLRIGRVAACSRSSCLCLLLRLSGRSLTVEIPLSQLYEGPTCKPMLAARASWRCPNFQRQMLGVLCELVFLVIKQRFGQAVFPRSPAAPHLLLQGCSGQQAQAHSASLVLQLNSQGCLLPSGFCWGQLYETMT